MKTQYTPSQLSLMEKASPDLLEALELVANYCANPYAKVSDFEDLVFKAISKATGKQPQ